MRRNLFLSPFITKPHLPANQLLTFAQQLFFIDSHRTYFFTHHAASLSKEAYELQCADKYIEAIAVASDALWYDSRNDAAYNVRGVCRFKMQLEFNADELRMTAGR